MRRVLGTVAGRLFLVLGLALVGAMNFHAARTVRVVEPTVWYFWTSAGSHVHLGQPGGREIVGQGFRPSESAAPLDMELKDWESRCGLHLRNKAKSSIVSAEWRGLTLCNAADLDGEEFSRRHAYFKTEVDRLYSRYYWEIADRHIKATALAIGIWLAAIGIYGVGVWIWAPRRRKASQR